MHLRLHPLLLATLLCPMPAALAAPEATPLQPVEKGLRDNGSAPASIVPLTIATRHAPPFSYKNADGQWTGIAIELWDRIAAQNGYDFRFVELGLSDLLDAVAAGHVDGAVGALTITRDREERFDFSHAFHVTGLGIAVPLRNTNPVSALARFLSFEFLAIVAALLALLVLIGILIWLAERRANAQFQRQALPGIGDGLWWSAVTMTTVGYGDKTPTTVLGRVLGLVWMFAALILVSTFTAAITTALTVNELDASINSVEDLKFKRVLTLAGSTSDDLLTAEGIRHQGVNDLGAALEKLSRGQADAVVHDAPILRHKIAEDFPHQLRTLPIILSRQVYGIALPGGSGIREPVNVSLLEIVGSGEWRAVLEGYLGAEH